MWRGEGQWNEVHPASHLSETREQGLKWEQSAGFDKRCYNHVDLVSSFFYFQLRFLTVTSSLFQISILRTVSNFSLSVSACVKCAECASNKSIISDFFFWSDLFKLFIQPCWFAKVRLTWESEDETGGQICEKARGLGGDAVTRWWYSNLFSRNRRPNEPVIMKCIWMPALCAALIYLHAFEKLNGSGPGNQ